MMNIALLSPNYNVVSETFIQYHKENLPGKVYYYYNGIIPKSLEGYGKFENKYYSSRFNRFKRKFLNINKNDEYFFERSLKENKIDLVFAEFGNTGATIYPICKKLGIPLITTWLGYEISIREIIKKFEKQYQVLFESDTKHIVVSKAMIPEMLKLGAKKENIIYSPLPGNEMFLNVKPNYKSENIIAIGRFVDKKAPYNLILSMTQVVKKYPNLKLNIVGNGPLFNTCFNLVKSLQLEKNVQLLGNKTPEEVFQMFNNSAIYIQHSLTALNGDCEGAPVAILEASLASLPIVSTRHSGIPDIVIDGETGYLVEENDVTTFAEKIIELLENKSKMIEMGEKGRKYISDNFSLEKHINIIKTITHVQ